MKIVTIVIGILAVNVLATAADAVSKDNQSQYHSEEGRFTVSFPSDWKTEEMPVDRQRGVLGAVAASSPDEGDSDPFIENINIVIVPADTEDLAAFNSRAIRLMQRNSRAFKLIGKNVETFGDHLVGWFTHTHSYQDHTLQVIKYTIIHDDKMFFITGTTLPESFERFQPIFNEVVTSIAFDDSTTRRDGASKVSTPTDVVYQILSGSPFTKITEEQVGSTIKTKTRVVVMLYAIPENVGLSNTSRNKQAERLAALYKDIVPNYSNISFYALEVKNKDDLERFSKKYRIEGIPTTLFFKNGTKVFNFKAGPDDTNASMNEFRSLIKRNLNILAR